MIIVETKLKEIPEKCTKCKLSWLEYDSVYGMAEPIRYCAVTKKPIQYARTKNNWAYLRPKWCPLKEI